MLPKKRTISDAFKEAIYKDKIDLPNMYQPGMIGLPWAHPDARPMDDLRDAIAHYSWPTKVQERYDPALDPFASTVNRLTCVWCGMKDRVEFFQSTECWSIDGTFFECKDERECLGRIALQAGRHQ